MDPELGDEQPPARRAALGPLGQVEQCGEVPCACAASAASRAFCAARSAIRSSSRARNMSALLAKREYTAPLEKPASSAIWSRVAA